MGGKRSIFSSAETHIDYDSTLTSKSKCVNLSRLLVTGTNLDLVDEESLINIVAASTILAASLELGSRC